LGKSFCLCRLIQESCVLLIHPRQRQILRLPRTVGVNITASLNLQLAHFFGGGFISITCAASDLLGHR
jgi:hypothetical protein